MILLSGDSDFVPAVHEVRNLHIFIQVAAYRDEENSCHDLDEACDTFINLHPVISPLLNRTKITIKKKAATN